jgi:sodium/pantothenate symporter
MLSGSISSTGGWVLQSNLINNTGELVFATALFVGYTIVLLYLGYDGYRKTEVLSDFAAGSGRIKAWWIGLSFGATYASANMFIGVPGFAYSAGTPGLWWIAVFTGLPFIGIVLIAKRFYQFGDIGDQRDITLPDWLGTRFNSPFLRVSSGLISLLLAFYVAGQVIGAGTMFERVFEIPYLTGIIISVVIAAAYVAGGGMRSTILTDLLQSIIMIAIAIVVFVSGVWMFGGINFMPTVIEGVAANGGNTGMFTTDTLTGLYGGAIPVLSIGWLAVAFILLPHLLNRVLAVQSEKELREFVLFSGIGLFFMSAFMQWAGLYAFALNPNLEFADAAVPMYINQAFPNVVAIIITVGLISAILTTTDSLLQGVGSIIGNDVYKHGVENYLLGNVSTEELRNGDVPRAVQERSIWAARAGVVITALIGLGIAYIRPPSLTIVTQLGITGLLSGITAPLVAGYYWRNCSRRAAEVGLVVGFGSYVVLFVGGIIDSFFVTFPISTFLSAIAVIAVTMAQGEDSYTVDRWDQVFGQSTNLNDGTDVGAANQTDD